MTIDILTPSGIAVDVKDAISELVYLGAPEVIGRVVQRLVDLGHFNADDLRAILPHTYQVREE